MKKDRGELIGYNGCYGYNYNIETKEITINEDEANIVRYMFERYVEGIGSSTNDNYSKKYPFSSKLYCAFCGSLLTRRNWNANRSCEKAVWQCIKMAKEEIIVAEGANRNRKYRLKN